LLEKTITVYPPDNPKELYPWY